jgi:hypothetical protein
VTKPVAILGFVAQERVRDQVRALDLNEVDLIGFNDPSPLYADLEFTRWYELHSRKKVDAGDDEPRHLRALCCPVYMIEPHPEVPDSVPYPKDEVLKVFPPYFTNSVSWILAHAILEGRPAIHLFGVDMGMVMNPGPEEFGEQRPSVEFFLGWARGAGIEVVIPKESDLLKTNVLYGYEEHVDSGYMKSRLRAQEMREYGMRARERAAFYEGAASAFASSARTYELTDDDVGLVKDRVE